MTVYLLAISEGHPTMAKRLAGLVELRPLLVAFALAEASDLLTTWAILALGGGEANGTMRFLITRYGAWVLLPVKIVFVAGASLSFIALDRLGGGRWWAARIWLGLAIIWQCFVIDFNALLIVALWLFLHR
jgi:Domain of unknown function (DUF5658)